MLYHSEYHIFYRPLLISMLPGASCIAVCDSGLVTVSTLFPLLFLFLEKLLRLASLDLTRFSWRPVCWFFFFLLYTYKQSFLIRIANASLFYYYFLLFFINFLLIFFFWILSFIFIFSVLLDKELILPMNKRIKLSATISTITRLSTNHLTCNSETCNIVQLFFFFFLVQNQHRLSTYLLFIPLLLLSLQLPPLHRSLFELCTFMTQ